MSKTEGGGKIAHPQVAFIRTSLEPKKISFYDFY